MIDPKVPDPKEPGAVAPKDPQSLGDPIAPEQMIFPTPEIDPQTGAPLDTRFQQPADPEPDQQPVKKAQRRKQTKAPKPAPRAQRRKRAKTQRIKPKTKTLTGRGTARATGRGVKKRKATRGRTKRPGARQRRS